MNIKHKADAAPASCGQHTPLPWIYWQPGFYGEAYSIGPRGNCPILKTLGDNERVNEANAELVIRAVNSHQELLEALKSCFAMLTSPKFSGWIDANCTDDELWAMTQAMIQRRDEARAAIAKAQGNTQ